QEIKKHKIKSYTQIIIRGSDSIISVKGFDKNGYRAMEISSFGDTVKLTNEVVAGKLKKVTVHNAGANLSIKDDVYTYDYEKNGNYMETFIDGSFGMVSYAWYDKD